MDGSVGHGRMDHRWTGGRIMAGLLLYGLIDGSYMDARLMGRWSDTKLRQLIEHFLGGETFMYNHGWRVNMGHLYLELLA